MQLNFVYSKISWNLVKISLLDEATNSVVMYWSAKFYGSLYASIIIWNI